MGAAVRLAWLLVLVMGGLFMGGLSIAPPATATSEPDGPDTGAVDNGSVDAYVEDYLDRHGLVGAAVAVVRDGQVLFTAGYGDTEGQAVTPDTRMAVGSVSKPFTAFAVLQLVDGGRIALDDPVVEHLPDLQMDDERASDITVGQLLAHTSGLPNPVIVAPANDLVEGVARLRDWRLVADPGASYRYSNFNYHLAARLVEVVSGTSFTEYLARHVFEPLGMDRTRSVTTTRTGDAGMRGGHVTAYGFALPVREMEQLVAGAGGVVTTAEDLSRWLVMLTNHGAAPGGAQLLSRALLEEAQAPTPGADGNGLGWHLSAPGATPPRVGHSGTTGGYSAQLDLVPGSGYGVAVMLNSFTPTFEHNYALSSGIIELTEGDTPSPGSPTSTWIDLGLGLAAVLVLALTALGVRRAGRWAARRSQWSGWRLALRLSPHAVFPALAALVFLVAPNLEGNSATMLDAFALWPAGMVLVLALAASGVTLIVVRGRRRAAPT
jgi:CubicO group peptidase (beta-lactamase class C family)